jgi:hypothetical protein
MEPQTGAVAELPAAVPDDETLAEPESTEPETYSFLRRFAPNPNDDDEVDTDVDDTTERPS